MDLSCLFFGLWIFVDYILSSLHSSKIFVGILWLQLCDSISEHSILWFGFFYVNITVYYWAFIIQFYCFLKIEWLSRLFHFHTTFRINVAAPKNANELYSGLYWINLERKKIWWLNFVSLYIICLIFLLFKKIFIFVRKSEL